MHNLKIASMDLKNKRFKFNKNNTQLGIIEKLLGQDLDVLTLQSLSTRVANKMSNSELSDTYHFDHLKGEYNTIIPKVIGNESNSILINNEYMNCSEVSTSSGLVVNNINIRNSKDKEDRYTILNVSLTKTTTYNAKLLANIIKSNDNMYGKSPIIITGNLNMDAGEIVSFLNSNDISSLKDIITYNGDHDCLLFSEDLELVNYSLKNDLVDDSMYAPFVANIKRK